MIDRLKVLFMAACMPVAIIFIIFSMPFYKQTPDRK